jgi:hypothetical protein
MRGAVGLGILVLAATVAVAGELPQTAKVEIGALLGALEVSGCRFYRNGTWHTAAEAKDHLQMKLDYFVKRDRIATAEEFIEKAGTKSSLSGQDYKVACPGQDEEPSAVWLGDALRNLRERNLVHGGSKLFD